jgi:pimeloyl-ACP methyl ester carboxylesterase
MPIQLPGAAWRIISLAIAVCLVTAVSGCAELRLDVMRAAAARIAQSGGFSALSIDAGQFTLAAYQRAGTAQGDTLVVYIEGDGMAWVDRGRLSENPTPSDPVALHLATEDNAPTILYLARPCQFVSGQSARNCRPKYWSTARFAIEVVEAAARAIDIVKADAGKQRIELIGYSGGGVLATLLAARRDDVSRVITIGANLDLSSWAAHHRVTPLFESLNPIDFVAPLSRIPQIIFVGGKDEVVPRSIAEKYRDAFPPSAPVRLVQRANFSHRCCWVEHWPQLLGEARGSTSR